MSDREITDRWSSYGFGAGLLIFFLFLTFWWQTTNFTGESIFLLQGSPYIFAAIFLLFVVAGVAVIFLINVGGEIIGFDDRASSNKFYFEIASAGVVWIFLFGLIIYTPPPHTGFWDGFIRIFGGIAYTIAAMLAIPLFITQLIRLTPYWMAGLIAWRTKHPSTQIVQKIAAGQMQAVDAEQQLMHLLRSGEVHDEKAFELISKMSIWQRWKWEISYREHVKNAQSLRSAVDTATKAVDADVDLLEATHELGRKEQSVEDRERLAELRAKKEEADAELAKLERELGNK